MIPKNENDREEIVEMMQDIQKDVPTSQGNYKPVVTRHLSVVASVMP